MYTRKYFPGEDPCKLCRYIIHLYTVVPIFERTFFDICRFTTRKKNTGLTLFANFIKRDSCHHITLAKIKYHI